MHSSHIWLKHTHVNEVNDVHCTYVKKHVAHVNEMSGVYVN